MDITSNTTDDKKVHDFYRNMLWLVPMLHQLSINSKKVCIAGSAALWMYMYMCQDNIPQWIPNDIDIYMWGMSEAHFKSILSHFVTNLREKLLFGEAKRDLKTSSFYYNVDAIPDAAFLMLDIFNINSKVPWGHNREIKKITFLLHPIARVSREVTKYFDINICKCQWFFKTEEWLLPTGINHYVQSKTALVVRPFNFANGFVPSRDDITRVVQTWNRMIKYTERGFTFLSGPMIIPNLPIADEYVKFDVENGESSSSTEEEDSDKENDEDTKPMATET